MIQQIFWRVIVTCIIWLMLGGIAIAAVLNAGINNLDVPAIAIPAMVMATIATGLIWRPTGTTESSGSYRNRTFVGRGDEKAKRGDSEDDPRLALLMELMDDDELQIFKERLKHRVLDETYVTDDGEIAYRGVSMADLLNDEAESRQHQQRH